MSASSAGAVFFLSRKCAVLLGLLGAFTACRPPAASPPVAPPAKAQEPVVAPKKEAPALNQDERTVLEGLHRHADRLTAIGERTPDTQWELAEAADYVAASLDALGYEVERQGYESGEIAAQNLSVTIGGGRHSGQILVVGTHYDSRAGSRGEESALSTAALLELAKMMKGASLDRTLRLAFFSMGESPHGDGEARGARHYARKLSVELAAGPPPGTPEPLKATYHSETLGLIHLGNFGDFSAPAASSDPSAVVVQMRTTSGGNHLAKTLEPALFGDPLHVRPETFSSRPEESDVLAFFEQGIPVVSIFGAAPSGTSNSRERQFAAAARVVMRLRYGIGEIVGEKPQNDGMVTPLSGGVR